MLGYGVAGSALVIGRACTLIALAATTQAMINCIVWIRCCWANCIALPVVNMHIIASSRAVEIQVNYISKFKAEEIIGIASKAEVSLIPVIAR